jgi:hypothetical protein
LSRPPLPSPTNPTNPTNPSKPSKPIERRIQVRYTPGMIGMNIESHRPEQRRLPVAVALWSLLAAMASPLGGCSKKPSGQSATKRSKAQEVGGPSRSAPASPAERRPRAASMGTPRVRATSAPRDGGELRQALTGMWAAERILVGGNRVPLPKGYRIRLHFQSDGALVVHGVRRTRPTRKEGTWRVGAGRLVTVIRGPGGTKREVRTLRLAGDRLTLTRPGSPAVVWHMVRVDGSPSPRRSEPRARGEVRAKPVDPGPARR